MYLILESFLVVMKLSCFQCKYFKVCITQTVGDIYKENKIDGGLAQKFELQIHKHLVAFLGLKI